MSEMQTARFPLPELGARIPGWTPRAVFAAVSLALCLCVLPGPWWIGAGIILTGICTAGVAGGVPVGLLVLELGASLLWQDASPANWRFYVVLAGLHVLVLLGTGWMTLGVRSWIQLAVFVPVGRRFLLVQVPTQLASFGLLSIFAARTPGATLAGTIGGLAAGAALAVLAAVLIVPMVRRRR